MKEVAFKHTKRAAGYLNKYNSAMSEQNNGMADLCISNLKYSEQIVVWAARRFRFFGHPNFLTDFGLTEQREQAIKKVSMEFVGVFLKLPNDTVGNNAAKNLASVISSFADNGYRGLKLNFQSCRSLSCDERLLLSLFAGCQSGNQFHVTEFLSWFFPPCKIRNVIQRAGAFSDLFKSNQLYIPQRINFSCASYQLAANYKIVH